MSAYDDDNEIYIDWGDLEVECVCGSRWWHFVWIDGKEAQFTIDDNGMPMIPKGHPRCAECGIDYPVVGTKGEDEDWEIFMSEDLTDDGEE